MKLAFESPRARLHDLGLVLLSASWLYWGPTRVSDHAGVAGALALVGGALLFGSQPADGVAALPNVAQRCIGVALAVVAWVGAGVYPAHVRWPLVVAAAAAGAVCLAGAEGSWLARLARRLASVGVIALVQALFAHLLARQLFQHGRIPFVAPLSGWLLRAIGWDAGADAGSLYLFDGVQSHEFTATAEKLALPFFLPCLAAIALTRTWTSNPVAPRRGAYWLLAVGYPLVRFACVSALSAGGGGALGSFVEPAPVLLSLVPFACASAVLARSAPDAPLVSVLEPAPRRGALAAVVLALLAAVSTAWSMSGFDAGVRKQGRVLIDDSHGQWESTSVAFDRENFGTRSVYSFTDLRRGLGYFYDTRVHEHGSIDATVLQDVDVLVLKTPFAPYTSAEQDAVRNYVAAGGGVLLVGDHTNFLGMGARLNEVGLPMGIAFRADHALRDVRGEFRGEFVYEPPLAREFLHPVLLHVDSLFTLGGCTFAALGWTTEAVMWDADLVSEPADYSQISFFRRSAVDGGTVQGPQRLAAAASYGAGRVVALGDSTIFSNFTMHDPGRWELLLGSVEFANRRNTLPAWHRVLAAALALASGVALLTLLARHVCGAWMRGLALSLVCAGLVGAPRAIGAWKLASYPRPAPRRALPTALVAGSAEPDSRLRPWGGTYQDAFNALARYGLFPQKRGWDQLGDLGRDVDVLVLIEPARSFDTSWLERIRRYVDEGGHVLVLDSVLNRHGTGAELLTRFGMHYDDQAVAMPMTEVVSISPFETDAAPLLLLDAAAYWADEQRKFGTNGRTLSSGFPVRGIVGGEPLYRVGDRDVVARVDVGSGRLVATTLGYAFSDDSLGDPFMGAPPDARTRADYEQYFRLLDALLAPSHPASESR